MVNKKPSVSLLTKEALEALKKEYEECKLQRERINEEINLARAEGDLSDNEAYHSGLLARDINEARIFEIEELLENYKIVVKSDNGTVQLGSRVKLRVNGQEKEYEIVSTNESNPLEGKISAESPIGSAILGKKVGDIARITLNESLVEYEILGINN